MQWIVGTLVGQQARDRHDPTGNHTEPRCWCATCAVCVRSLRSRVSSMTSTPPSCEAIGMSAQVNSRRRALTPSASHTDSDEEGL